MTKMPERIWAWDFLGHKPWGEQEPTFGTNGKAEYLRADTAIPRAEANAMAAAALEKAVSIRPDVAVRTDSWRHAALDMEKSYRAAIQRLVTDDARAAFERAVREAENRIISAFRVNMMRLQPDYTHEKFDALIAAIRKGDDQ